MIESWTELWSSGHGPSRTYCGIARTEEGFAVDVFKGDSCIASEIYGSQSDAQRAAQVFARRYMRRQEQSKPAIPAAAQRNGRYSQRVS
ncbi:MAG TPA: hypothetical protein VLD67_00955 [Vicinamibacterales bacterium]|nr:hypothetical protein [Vicinamibacterales bacterium]